MAENTNVCVITGGGSGLGLTTAKIIGENSVIVIAGRTLSKLEKAVRKLEKEHITTYAFQCDVSDAENVNALASFAKGKGRVTAVINSAGISPSAGNSIDIIRTNAIGAINVNNAFYSILTKQSCIAHVSSMAAYLIPKILIPQKKYPLYRKNFHSFEHKIMSRLKLFPKKHQTGIAYAISKHFILWFVKAEAGRFGERGIRIISVSPGYIATEMGELEKENADKFIRHCAIKRLGDVNEIAYLLSSCVDKRMGYLTGNDILCDGGLIGSGFNMFSFFKKNRE